MITLIMAADDKGGIGYKNDLPWPKNHVDMLSFVRHTFGKTVICGKNTYNSLPTLHAREVIMCDRNWSSEVEWFDLAVSKNEYIVIGGATIYKACIDQVDEFILHRIRGEYEADTFAPFSLPWL